MAQNFGDYKDTSAHTGGESFGSDLMYDGVLRDKTDYMVRFTSYSSLAYRVTIAPTMNIEKDIWSFVARIYSLGIISCVYIYT